jgi:hypothetical protein
MAWTGIDLINESFEYKPRSIIELMAVLINEVGQMML